MRDTGERGDEEQEVRRDTAAQTIRGGEGGGGVETQAAHLRSQHPGSPECQWVSAGCGPLRAAERLRTRGAGCAAGLSDRAETRHRH